MTARVRVEWLKTVQFHADQNVTWRGLSGLASPATLYSVTGQADPVSSDNAPQVQQSSVALARVTVLSGAVICTPGAEPVGDADGYQDAGVLIAAGQEPQLVRCQVGQPLWFVEAVEAPAAPAGGGGGGGGAVTAADGALVTMGSKADGAWDLAAAAPSQMGLLKKAALLLSSILTTLAGTLLVNDGTAKLAAGDNRKIQSVTTSSILFSDDFGGTALDLTKWDVHDGGIAPIGSGINMGNGVNDATNTALSVNNSVLHVTMGQVLNAELWLMSKQIFSCTEDVSFSGLLTSFLAQNSIRIGLVEVDPATGNLVPNVTSPAQFNNGGGVEYAATTNSTAGALWAVSDGSPNETMTAFSTLTSSSKGSAPSQDTQIEYHAEDIIASSCNADTATARSSSILRISSQVPNDGKAYKLLLRFRNINSAPASSTVFQLMRILVADGHEMRVEVASGRGDQNAQKAIAVNVASIQPGSNTIGNVNMTGGYIDSTSAWAAGATFTGTSRMLTLAANAAWSWFGATAYSDAGGTLYLQMTHDNGANWHNIDNAVIPAGGGSVDLSIRVRGAVGGANTGYRCVYVNGATAQTVFRLASSFTAN